MPTKVTVTGAAGQIGYALLFRIASGQMLGPDEQVHLRLLEIPHAVKAAEGTAMELDDCAFPLLSPIDITDDPKAGLRRRQRRAARRRPPAHEGHGARRPARGQRRHLQAPGRGDQRRRRRRRQGPRGRQPGQHERPDRAVATRPTCPTRALHRDDAPRPQPRDRAARQEARRAASRHHEHDGLGQPLADDVPRPVQRQGRAARAPGTSVDDEAWVRERVHPDASASAARRSSRRAAPRRRRRAANAAIDHVHDWVLGRRRRLGLDGGPVRRPYGVARGDHLLVPRRAARGGEYEIVEGLEVDDFSQAKIDATVEELKEERDAVSELGLV